MCLGFETETSNRVVRKFIEEEKFSSESFLRLHIGDENGKKIFGFDLTSSIENRIRSAILSGIKVNGRHYLFLAFSSSQLKEGCVWMVSPERSWTIAKMRTSMGDFSVCKTPSKYAARIGQCFSTTFQGLGGRDAPRGSNSFLRHVEVEDVASIYDNVPHSDGNGLISNAEMLNLLRSMPNLTPKVRENTSVVQIRYGGAKGILVAWDASLLNKIAGSREWTWHQSYDVVLRKSMIKFDAPFRFLEVCR
jgi:RNA-dependent RNA polymerase